MKVTPALLARVAQDNIRDHQIGETRDGISWDVARDQGFLTPAEAAALPISPEAASLSPDGMPAETKSRLTSAEQNANARKEVSEHLRRVVKQVVDPHYG